MDPLMFPNILLKNCQNFAENFAELEQLFINHTISVSMV